MSDDDPRPAEKLPDVSQIPDTAAKTSERIWTREEKLRACATWVTDGTVLGTAEKLGMDREVLRRWVKSKWWPIAVAEARRKFEDQITGTMSAIIQASQGKLLERIKNGDVRINKHGGEVHVPVAARDLAVIQAIAFDKRQIISGRPTTIRAAQKSPEDRANELRGKAARKPAKPADTPAPGSNVVPIKAAS